MKPDWSPDTALSRDYVGRPCILRRAALARAGGLRPAFGAAMWYDALLRVAEAAGTLESPQARTLTEAFGFIFSLRHDHQVEQLRRGEVPDDSDYKPADHVNRRRLKAPRRGR